VAHSRKHGTPVLIVQINYRLGPFGFSASKDLAEEANGGSKTHPVGNYGLIDQRNALEWVNKHIQDFGGDPSNITVFGVSAGSVSTHLHILAEHSLFDRAIMMSGAAPVLGPLRMEYFENEWNSLCRKTSINASTSWERLHQLRSLSVMDILKNSSSAAMGPVADGKLLREGWKYDDNMSNSRCKEIIVGDTDVEGIIFDGLLGRLSQSHFRDLVDKNFSPHLANELFINFGFSRAFQSEEEYRKAFRTLVGNTMFNYSNVGIAKASRNSDSWRDKVYLYHMGEPSPFSGTTNGLSYHGLCALFLHLNELPNLPPGTQDLSREMARIWTAFAHGKQPWEPYSKSERFMRFGPHGKCELHSFESDDTRDYIFQTWLGEHIDEVGRFIRDIILF
jgi:carboxylesterase type B